MEIVIYRNEVMRPDLKQWSKNARKIFFDQYAFYVAPEDVADVEGNIYWNYEDAQKIAESIGGGWRLPTPAEMQLLITIAAIDMNQESVEAETLKKKFGFDYIGHGVSCGAGTFLRQSVGEYGSYWTSGSMKGRRSGVILRMNASLNAGYLYSMSCESGAAVRLIKTIYD